MELNPSLGAPFQGGTLPYVTSTTPNSPPLPPFKSQVLSTWMKINAASARLQIAEPPPPILPIIPSHYTAPSFFHPLLDGENVPVPELPLYLLLRFVMFFKPRPSLAKRYSLMTPLSKDRLRGMLECLSPISSVSAILNRESTITDPILALAADLLACPPHVVDKNCLLCSFQPAGFTQCLLELMRATLCAAVMGSASMVLSVTRL